MHAILRRASMGTLALVVLVLLAQPASAGGTPFDTVRARYQPGDVVTLVGYTGGGTQGWLEDGPFYGYLRRSQAFPWESDVETPDDFVMALGRLTVTETGRGGYLAVRASITFTLPADIAPGRYYFAHCNAGCREGLGDLTDGTIHVGVDPGASRLRDWPLDDPEIANLEPDTMLGGPYTNVSAGQVQAGEVEIDPRTGFPAEPPPSPPSTTPPLTASSVTVAPPTTAPPRSAPSREATNTTGPDEPDVETAALLASAGGRRDEGTSSLVLWALVIAAAAALAAVGGVTVVKRRRSEVGLDTE